MKIRTGGVVSIQLISPASGDLIQDEVNVTYGEGSFHSINIPSEWGQDSITHLFLKENCFHSINIPSEWGLIRVRLPTLP